MGNNQLSGVIPQEIDLLTHLKHLYINVNKLRGLVPREVRQQLVLYCNGLSGWFPSSFGNLNNLAMLNLNNN